MPSLEFVHAIAVRLVVRGDSPELVLTVRVPQPKPPIPSLSGQNPPVELPLHMSKSKVEEDDFLV
jgi:hypothetical protein